MLRLPASLCSPSTFCVISVKGCPRFSIATSALCAAFGLHVPISPRHQSSHSQTSFGSRSKAGGVARSSARKLRQRPSVPRNVGTPLSPEMPAPVRTAMR